MQKRNLKTERFKMYPVASVKVQNNRRLWLFVQVPATLVMLNMYNLLAEDNTLAPNPSTVTEQLHVLSVIE